MRRGGAGLIAAMLALAGCKNTGTKPPDRDAPGTPASRSRDTTPTWLGSVGGPHAVPKANSWTHPNDPNFNTAAEAQGVLGGIVLDPNGRPAGNVYIRVELADATPAEREKGGAPVGIMTDAKGFFQAKGLRPKRAYNLTAESKQDGKPLSAEMQVATPNPTLKLQLRDDLAPPPPADVTPSNPGTLPPPAELSPRAGSPAPRPAPRTTDGAWSPDSMPATRPVPNTFSSPVPPVGTPALPPPADVAPRPTTKPENVADGPKDPFRAPPTSIPGGVPIPKLPPPSGVAPPPDPKQSAAPVRQGANFALRDSSGRPWEFATDRGQLTLLDFMTTTCVPCKTALPVLTSLQERYGASGFDVVGVVCDPRPLSERVALADRYLRANNLNYLMYTEDAAEQGALFRKYADASTGYPFVVLLDASGNVLWKGHPSDRGLLEAQIRQHLAR